MLNNCYILISKKKISISMLDFLSNKNIGAVVSFVGVVRQINNGKQVNGILYSIFEDLMYSLLKDKCLTLLNGDNNTRICIFQYNGNLNVGGVNLLIGVGSKHRKIAFSYCNQLVDFIKYGVPVWKKEIYSDGTYNWINS